MMTKQTTHIFAAVLMVGAIALFVFGNGVSRFTAILVALTAIAMVVQKGREQDQ